MTGENLLELLRKMSVDVDEKMFTLNFSNGLKIVVRIVDDHLKEDCDVDNP